ncbi:MAG: hypothetical protein ASARMPREDX12_003662 [Alectoria sarmentosa]|nr:MAG: hypothetical protein ASARMPRED_008030 [Alectoria sarmentosa]CAD6570522.1 MAG: hypothetical protein ASARMPREDX12_003662 [Alectoria sarmentosa]
MLSSRKALEPQSLHGSTTRTILLSQSRTCHRPPPSLFAIHREFSWGSKHKNTSSRAGKVCKGFGIQDLAGKDMPRKQLYRSTLWGHHHLRQYLPRYAPIQEWRFSSSWGRKSETHSSSRSNAEAKQEEDDWYTRWEKQKLRQYDDFMKKVEHDPYTALFGKSWLNFSGEGTEPKAARTPSPRTPKEPSAPKNERTTENWPSNSKPSSTKVSETRDISGRQSKSETRPVQEHDHGYEIDPITNRKVLKKSAPPVSKVERHKPQIKDVGKAFEISIKRWNLVSPTPLDARFIIADQAQPLSSSYPPSRDTPRPKPDRGNGWLAQEGFGNFKESKADVKPTPQTHDAKQNITVTKIESALDRHLSRKSTNGKNDRPQLLYKPEENKAEDVDLLRPSDVRASAGLRGNSPKETDVNKQARRQKLEEDYESRSFDRESQLAVESESKKLVQKREVWPGEKNSGPELRFGSWLKGTLQDTKIRDKDASKGTPAAWEIGFSDARGFDPVSVDQNPDSTLASKTKLASEPSNAVAPEAQAEARDKTSKLKAQIVPFKAKLDVMKADYEALRQQWLQETRRLREKAAKKEEEMKAQKFATRARDIHEEEIKTQKVAMEAMEMRSSDGSINVARTALGKGTGNDDGEKPAPRRLQSFLQGEGDMASNVHEFAGRDRWYKRKAPHAMDAKDVEMDAKLQRIATDRALIREVRGIYEDTYGTIDTKHRQTHALSAPSIESSGHPITSSSGRVVLHAQLPSNTAGIKEYSQGLGESQNSDTLEIIQRLFGQLREAQSLIQDYRSQTKQALGPSDQNTNTFKTSSAFERCVKQIVATSGQLASVRPGDMMAQRYDEATAATNSNIPTINSPLSTTAQKSTKVEIQKATKLNTYCILAYDSTTQKVNSAEATTVAPFSNEESLLPLDALNRLSNPGKFLPHVMSLGDKGYEPVSGTHSILVFKKEITPQELAETKKTDAMKEPNPFRNLLDHSPVVSDNSIGNGVGNWPFDPITEEDVEKYRLTQSDGIGAEQQKVKEAQKQAAEKMDKEEQKVEEARKTAMDGIEKGEQPFEEDASASPSHRSSDKVHRQETVFSGSRQGRWVDSSVKHKKSKRTAGRRRQNVKRMLMAGAFTAACCYCVGVASEMMQSW